MSAGQACPVCLWPDQESAVCGRCGWELIGGYQLGPASEADRRDLAARLAAGQRDHDLRAAARAAGPAGSRDQALLMRLTGLVRGGPPSPGKVEQVVAQVDADEPPPARTSAGIVFALTRLVAGKTDAIAFVEIGRDAVSVQTVVADALGVPARVSEKSLPGRLVGDSLAWTSILPLLPAVPDLRYLRMAGGVGSGSDAGPGPGDAGHAALIAAVDDAIRPALARLTAAAAAAAAVGRAARGSDDPGGTDSSPHGAPHRLDTVLVRRTEGWPLLDAAVARGRAALRPVAEIVAAPDAGSLAEVVDDMVTHAPLRYGYDLVLVEVDRRTGAVSPRAYQLFPPGAAGRPGVRPVKVVTVAPVPGHATRHLALPIVARRGPVTDWRDLTVLSEQRPLVAMATLDSATAGPYRLRVRLSRPGRPRPLPMPGLLPPGAGPSEWPGLLSDLPKRLPTASVAAGLDLVLMVELGGAEEDVAARVRLARGVVEAFRGAQATRIAVMGYRDHFGRHHVDAIAVRAQETDALVVGCGLSTVPGALSMFQRPERWQAVPVGDDNAAPVEDALHMIADPRWDWRPAARHVLLVVGLRPPHPAKAGPFGDMALPCPHRYSWPDMLGGLRDEQALECFAVLDHRPATGYAEQAWRQFGAQGRLWRESSTVHDIARAVGLAAGPGPQLRLATLVGAATSPSYREETGA